MTNNVCDSALETTKILLKNGNIVNANSVEVGDVFVKNGKISKVSRNIEPCRNTKIIDATNMYVLPGGIDPNTHFFCNFDHINTIDDFFYGTKAAVFGGTTTILDVVKPKLGETMNQAFAKWREKADEKVVCDYGLHMNINHWNEQVLKEMETMSEKSIRTFMINMALTGDSSLTDAQIYRVFVKCRELGTLAMVQAENGSIIEEKEKKLLQEGVFGPEGHYLSRPTEVQVEATFRAKVIANLAECPIYFSSVMSEDAAEIISMGRQNQIIFGETLAAAIGCNVLTDDDSFQTEVEYIMKPPIINTVCNQNNLMKRLATGGLSTIGSGNCTFLLEQKHRGKFKFTKIPDGVNGVEDRMSVVWEKGVNKGILTPSEFVAVTSTNAAKIFNLYPRKGVIAAGSDADIVIWNPNRVKRISTLYDQHASDFNIFEGLKVHGGPEYVLVRGRVCLDKDVLLTTKGYGKFLKNY